jgi:poly [ADP-ribose] polymerase
VSGTFNQPRSRIEDAIRKNGGSITKSIARAAYVVADAGTNADCLAGVKAGLPVLNEEWVAECVKAGALQTDDKFYVTRLSAKISAPAAAAAAPAAAPAASGRASRAKAVPASAPAPAAAAASSPAAAAASSPAVRGRKRAASPPPSPTAPSPTAPAAPAKRGRAAAGAAAAAAAAAPAPALAAAVPAARGRGKAAAAAAAAAVAPSSNSTVAAVPASTITTVMVKGLVPVDTEIPSAGSYTVYHDSKGAWDAMLNQTNLGENNNKYYLVQLLVNDTSKAYCTWFRWGRVGLTNGVDYKTHGSLQAAQAYFTKKYTDKSANAWRAPTFVSRSGKYTLIERDFGTAAANADAEADAAKKPSKKNESKLDKRVQSLVSLICDLNMMKKHMLSVGYDANRMPLGKLSKASILNGYNVLSEIAAVLNAVKRGGRDAPSASKAREQLLELSSAFYTAIPHAVGMSRLPSIDTEQMLKDKIEMCEALAQIDAAVELVKADDDEAENALDAHYKRLKCAMTPVDKDGEVFKLVQEYITNTHASTHSYYKLELTDVLELARENEQDRFNKAGFNKDKNRQLLWHGSRLTNFVGILSQGLRIAPPEAPVTGYMFGKGVYFADMVSKSANYCGARPGDEACLLLCEVALGAHNELLQSDYNANKLPAGKLSTKGCGRTYPSSSTKLADGVSVPTGAPVMDNNHRGSLLYNEFIVYDVAQIRMRYLVRVRFHKN